MSRLKQSMRDADDSDRGYPLVDSLADWLIDQSLRDVPLDAVYEGTCKQLYAAGIPVVRCHISYRVLHPLFEAQSLHWERDAGVENENYFHGIDKEQWERSPLHYMLVHNLSFLRRHLIGDSAILDFELLEELRGRGYTDYLGFVVVFKEYEDIQLANGIIGSWSTDREGGFNNADIRSLRRIEQRLAVAFKINIQSQMTKNILSAYLGPGAGERVLNGQIKRGDGETIYAVVWYSDMRDSTRLADSMPQKDFLQALNAYFESTAGAVLDSGGEVLRFIGDAVLAIFPISDENSAESACRQAMRAAAMAVQRIRSVNGERSTRGEEPLDFGLGLHVGNVLFGNIGTPQRVEFSVIGSAANVVARVESLTKSLNCRILVSEPFAAHLELPWVDAGRHALRGVGQKISVYRPPEHQ